MRPFYHHFERRYQGKYRFARSLFLFDLFLIGVVFGLAMTALGLFLFKQASFADRILFEADVAPREVVTGAPATLVFQYTNGTGEELRDVRLSFDFPAHFLLQELTHEDMTLVENDMEIGTLAPGATGNVKVRGVMFGDVGGEQVFQSFLTFTHGEQHLVGQKISTHTIIPKKSALELELALPEKLVAYQPFSGTIRYTNTGPVDFPELLIEPEWPSAFAFAQSEPALSAGAWKLPGIASGSEGVVEFFGVIRDAPESATFAFHPSFVFDEDRYQQKTLTHTAPLVPAQVNVSHRVETDVVRPGGTISAIVRYENTGETPVYDLELSLESDSPFAMDAPAVMIGTLAPGASGEATVSLPLKNSVSQNALSSFENISMVTRANARYRMEEAKSSQAVSSLGAAILSPLTTSATLRSFGRYASEQGDQLGRGPLPPTVGEETKYWIFWNLSGTTNALTNVRLEGHLPDSVTFTGRQTVSVGEPIAYDATGNRVVWTAARVEPTFASTAKIVGMAFEVAITPTEAQISTVPTLLSDVRLTATDAWTGAVVTASGAVVTTNLPYDSMAAGLGVVVE